MTTRFEPGLIVRLLDWPGTELVAKLALSGAYLLGAADKLSHWPGAVAEQAHFGLHPPAFWAAVTIGVELLGPALLFTRRWVWLGAGMLGVFTGLAALVANAFWTMQGPDRFATMNAFFEHIGLIGGFVLVAVLAHRKVRKSADED